MNDNNMHAALMALFLALMGTAVLSYRDAGPPGRHRLDHPSTPRMASVRVSPGRVPPIDRLSAMAP